MDKPTKPAECPICQRNDILVQNDSGEWQCLYCHWSERESASSVHDSPFDYA